MSTRNSYLTTLAKMRRERQNATLTNRDKDRLNNQMHDLKFKIKEFNRDEINKIELVPWWKFLVKIFSKSNRRNK